MSPIYLYFSLNSSPLKYTPTEDGGSVFVGDEDNHSPQNSEDDCKKEHYQMQTASTANFVDKPGHKLVLKFSSTNFMTQSLLF